MFHRLAYFILFAFLSASSLSAQDLLITDVTIVSTKDGVPHLTSNVLIKQGRIATIGALAAAIEGSVTTLDGAGKYLAPGLMDSHAHVSLIPGIGKQNSPLAAAHPKLLADYHQQQPRSFLFHGVTQILDPGPLPGFEIFTEQPLHPDFFHCGTIPNLGGYPEMPIEEAIKAYPYFVIDSDNPGKLPSDIDPANHTPEAVVARMATDGARCVKIYLEDGFGAASQWPLLSHATFRRIQTAAKIHEIPTVAHANAIDMYQIAFGVGVDILGHGLWNWQWDEEQNGPSPLQSVLGQIVKERVGYMPTLRVMAGLQEALKPTTLANPAFTHVVPQPLLTWYQSDEAKWFGRELTADFGPDATPASAAEMLGYGVGRAKRATLFLSQEGHPLLLGSDFPGSATFANQPGLTTLQEMRMLAEAGIPLIDIFNAATINNARQFGLEADYGSIESGKIANLLLLTKNPLETVDGWDSIETVILHGKPIDRSTLAANR